MSEKKIPEENPIHDKMSVGVHTVAAIAMGYVSLTLASAFGNWMTVFTGFGFLVLMGFALQKALGDKGIKWLVGNGVLIYLFVWLISWTFFFNMII